MKYIIISFLIIGLFLSGCTAKNIEEDQKICPAMCVPMYEIKEGKCAFNECGSGCGADGKTTFMTEDACTGVTGETQLIGGQRDEHGCLGPAGYSWDNEVGACTRSWELNEDQKTAAKTAISPLSYYVTIIEVEVLKCPGCYKVTLERNDNQQRSIISIMNGTISKEETTEHICTEEEKKAQACTMEYSPVCGKAVLNMGDTVYQTYGNGCGACVDMKVVSYTQGECPQEKQQLVGNDKDEHGCIGSAGYTWCESKQKCLRVWEEDCPEDKENIR